MVDMHIHTLYSDGDKTLEEVLTICEANKLDYISITDHNTCKAYEDKKLKENIYSGKIVLGAEMNAYIDAKRIEFLAYNIKYPEIINEWSDNFYSKEVLKEKFNRDKNKIINMCDQNGLVYDLEILNKEIPYTDFFIVHMFNELIKHPENIKFFGEDIKNFNDFRKLLGNPESIFYMESDNSPKPMYKDVVDIIHKSGGLAFLAHPYEYGFQDTLAFIDKLKNEIKLDGIECFHPSSEEDEKSEILVKYAKENNLFISGGSDYHGDKKPGNYIGIGNGSLNISKNYIEDWVE